MSDEIRWNNLTVSNPSTGAFLINGLTGIARSGDFLAVMGPSGSGKSTFLQYLTSRLTVPKGFKATGTVPHPLTQTYINDLAYNLRKFSKFGVFVRQDDVLFSCLTVEGT
jgi:ABC-type multidrug transport system ATPase subunit